MTSDLRILLLEDDPEDAELIRALLEADRIVCEMTRVQTRTDFLKALDAGGFELVLADYTLPSFDGLAALKLVLDAHLGLPFIFVSGTLGEDAAIEALKGGATDYVLKTRMTRLAPVVRRALREARERAERKKAEEALRRSEQVEETLRAQARSSLLNLAHDAIFIHGMDGVITFWNRGAEVLYGYTANEAQGKFAPELLKTVFLNPFELKDGLWQGELVRTRKDGAEVVVASRWSLQRDEKGKPVAILETNNDVTERKRAEEALRLREQELRNVIEAIPAITFTTSADGRNVWANQRWTEFSGRSLEETAGLGWQTVLHPDDLDRYRTGWLKSVATGEPFEVESRFLSAKSEYRWFLARAVPLRDKQGAILRWYGTLTDIEDRKRAELERERARETEADLARMSRASMMGELAASLAHEITQPIVGASANAMACLRWLDREMPEIEEGRRAAARIVQDLNRVADIIDRTRSLFRRATTERERVDLNALIREMIVLLRDAADRSSVSIGAELDPDLPAAMADRVQLQQVLMNLALNGIEARKNGRGTLKITSSKTEDGQLMISVADCGVGLPAGDPESIFKTFYTTKPHGTGMGLSISRRIIESHGGRLWAQANDGPGATLSFTLPGQAE